MDTDLQGNMIGAVREGLVGDYKIALGYSKDDCWYNMGVALVDIDKWKAEYAEEKILAQLRIRKAYVAVDQDLLNITQHNSIVPISPKYNATAHNYVYSWKAFIKVFPENKNENIFYTKEVIEDAQQHAIIRHFERFVGEQPWHENTIHPHKEYFDKYLAMSPWADYVKKPAKKSFSLKVEKILYKMLPHDIFLYIWALSFKMYHWKLNAKYKKNEDVENIV